MRSHVPGTVLLYRETGSDLPLWPSVYLTDEVAPDSFLQTRPVGFHTLVLKLARVLDVGQLRWALTSEMNEFDPFAADKKTKESTPGLGDAYDVALEALDHGLDLNHWKSTLATKRDHEVITIDSDDDDDLGSDDQMRQAIELGIVNAPLRKIPRPPPQLAFQGRRSNIQSDQLPPRTGQFVPHLFDNELSLPVHRQAQQPLRLHTPTPSSPAKVTLLDSSLRLPKRLSPPLPACSDDELPSPSRRRKLSFGPDMSRQTNSYNSASQLSQRTVSPTFTFSDDENAPLPPCRRRSGIANGLNLSGHLPQQSAGNPSEAAGSGLSAKELFMRNGLHASASAMPDDDIIEGDLDESSQFVQVFVGPEIDPAEDPNVDPQRRRYKLLLLKHHVWERPYFRDTLSGRNYIEPIGENTWELVHPRLVDISPEDFRWVAEFLSDGDFGIRDPEDEEQVAETFAECMSAWRTAEVLSMDDLLERIVDKLRTAQPLWDLWNVFAFACSLYQNEVSLQAHDEMKALFAEYIADLFYIYLEDDHLSSTFLTRLKQLPELERDILMKRAVQLNRRLSSQEEEVAPQEEPEENDMELYN